MSKTGLARGLFANWRYRDQGSRELDPAFVLNDPRYADAQILLSGANFGCGSSREHAAWALGEYGFRAVLASSFNPIFRGNCINNGIVPVALESDAIAEVAASLGDAPATRPITVDLIGRSVTIANGTSWDFGMADEERDMLLTGMDAIERTLTRRDLIQAKREADERLRPWIYL